MEYRTLIVKFILLICMFGIGTLFFGILWKLTGDYIIKHFREDTKITTLLHMIFGILGLICAILANICGLCLFWCRYYLCY